MKFFFFYLKYRKRFGNNLILTCFADHIASKELFSIKSTLVRQSMIHVNHFNAGKKKRLHHSHVSRESRIVTLMQIQLKKSFFLMTLFDQRDMSCFRNCLLEFTIPSHSNPNLISWVLFGCLFLVCHWVGRSLFVFSFSFYLLLD